MLDCVVFKCYTFVSLSVKVSQKQTRMSLRRQVINDVGDIPSGDQQEDEDLDDRDDNVKNCENKQINTGISLNLGVIEYSESRSKTLTQV